MEPNPNPNPEPTPEPIPAENQELATTQAELAAARAEIEAHRATVAQVQLERDDQALRLADADTRATAAATQALSAHRRAVLAENAGQVIAELVQGDTAEALNASIETAKAAYTRVVDAVKTQVQALVVVPPGASPRSEPEPEALSPLQKITGALSRNGR